MDIVNKKCPICGSPVKSFQALDDYDRYEYNCYRCGKFKVAEEVTKHHLTNEQRVNISGWIREHQGSDIIIDEKRLESLMTLPELSVFEKADMMLQYLVKKFPVAGTRINYQFNQVRKILYQIDAQEFPVSKDDNAGKTFYKNASDLLPLIAIGRIIDKKEFKFIWEEYLINTKKYISGNVFKMITPAGWAYLETFHHPNPESKKAFVAMWFDDVMEGIYDNYIRKAIKDAGYKSVQIGRKEHNNDINDEIISEIRSCKFVVADFTGSRGGVYYEAGFAHGLNLEVIHTCKDDHLKDVHFDINHRNIIKWKDGEELYKKLLNRIKATIV